MIYQEVNDLTMPELQVYRGLTDRQLRNLVNPSEALMVVESPKVIKTALMAGCRPVSLLAERKHLDGDAAPIVAMLPGDVPIYTGSRELLAGLTGYSLTRGVLSAMHRPDVAEPEVVCQGATRVCVIAGVCDTTNIGSIFRSAAALGIDAILLTRDSCDPLNRRSIRVSMGTVFQVPWTWIDSVSQLKEMGFTTAAMALRSDSVPLDDPELARTPKLAIIMGTEGEGLPDEIIGEADKVVLIPMSNGVDSLNVGVAAGIAFWQFRKK